MKKGSGTFLFIEVYRSNRTVNEQRQGIIMAMVPCLLCYMTRLGAIAAYVRTEGLYTSGKV